MFLRAKYIHSLDHELWPHQLSAGLDWRPLLRVPGIILCLKRRTDIFKNRMQVLCSSQLSPDAQCIFVIFSEEGQPGVFKLLINSGWFSKMPLV